MNLADRDPTSSSHQLSPARPELLDTLQSFRSSSSVPTTVNEFETHNSNAATVHGEDSDEKHLRQLPFFHEEQIDVDNDDQDELERTVDYEDENDDDDYFIEF